MRNTKCLIIFLFILINSSCTSIDYKKTIEKEFVSYNELIENGEFEKSTNYIIPDFFELIPKSQLIKAMEQTYNNPAFEYEIKNKKISDISDSKTIEKKYYSSFTFSNDMLIKVKRKFEEKDNEYIKRVSNIKHSIEKSLGSENVDYIKEKETILIRSLQNVFAISNNGTKNWRFLVFSKNQKAIAKKILPKDISKGI